MLTSISSAKLSACHASPAHLPPQRTSNSCLDLGETVYNYSPALIFSVNAGATISKFRFMAIFMSSHYISISRLLSSYYSLTRGIGTELASIVSWWLVGHISHDRGTASQPALHVQTGPRRFPFHLAVPSCPLTNTELR